MPRNGSGVYSKPPNTTAVPNTTVRSAQFNQSIDDLAADANTPRPITAGGTGSSTVSGAQAGLSVDNKVVYAVKTDNYTAVAADNNVVIRFTAAKTLTLSPAATLGQNWHATVSADGARVIVDPNSSETINGSATLVIESGQTALIICDGTQFFAFVSGSANSGQNMQGSLYGLTLANNASDATNDIDIAAGWAAADVSPYYIMQLASGLTKRLDAAWAVGSNAGGLDTGTVADNTYHVWLIERSDTGVVDVLFSLSATSPTMPANYDRKRRIGSIIRFGSTILSFVQFGDTFVYGTVIANRNSTAAFPAAFLTVSVPNGVKVIPILQSNLSVNSGGIGSIAFGAADAGGVTTFVQIEGSAGNSEIIVPLIFWTNTNRQLWYQVNVGAGTLNANTLSTAGWIDPRGRW